MNQSSYKQWVALGIIFLVLAHGRADAGVVSWIQKLRADRRACATKLTTVDVLDPSDVFGPVSKFNARLIEAIEASDKIRAELLLDGRYATWGNSYPGPLYYPGDVRVNTKRIATLRERARAAKLLTATVDEAHRRAKLLWPRLEGFLRDDDVESARRMLRDLHASDPVGNILEPLVDHVFYTNRHRGWPLKFEPATTSAQKRVALVEYLIRQVYHSREPKRQLALPTLQNVPKAQTFAEGLGIPRGQVVEMYSSDGYEYFLDRLLGLPTWVPKQESFSRPHVLFVALFSVVPGARDASEKRKSLLYKRARDILHEPAVLSFKIEARFVNYHDPSHSQPPQVPYEHIGQMFDLELRSFGTSPTLRFHDVHELRAAFLTKKGTVRRRPILPRNMGKP